MVTILAVLLGIPLLIIWSILNGFCASVIWNWIAVPVLHAPPLTTASAIGLCAVMNFFISSGLKPVPKDEREPWLIMTSVALHYAVPLTIAWIVKQFI